MQQHTSIRPRLAVELPGKPWILSDLVCQENMAPGSMKRRSDVSTVRRTSAHICLSSQVRHTQNPVRKWSTQNHMKNLEGGRSYYGWDYPLLTFIYSGVDCGSSDETRCYALIATFPTRWVLPELEMIASQSIRPRFNETSSLPPVGGKQHGRQGLF